MKLHCFRLPALCFLLATGVTLCGQNTPVSDFHGWAPSPPMGWNSWDCFATTITEAQTKIQADVMSQKLLPHGWKYLVVDHQWFESGANGFSYRKRPELVMDGFGRLQPALNRFPSAANGAGFKLLADYVHSKGLKFGIHIMRGIPRQAVEKNTPVFGTSYHAAEIADQKSVCSWNDDMYGVDMSKPGAQEFYNSRIRQYADWGVDFIKVDDLSRPYHGPEIEAIRKAIDLSGRPIVFSTSPGETPVSQGRDISQHANMWRISDDFWDKWPHLLPQFKRLHDWTPYRGSGAWPDADMLPLGRIDLGHRSTHFTADEQVTMMTLWSIARSPLILGADMTKLDAATMALLTNDEVIAVNQQSQNNRQLFRADDGLIAWIADVPGSADKYLAVFNTRDAARNSSPGTTMAIPVKLAGAGLTGSVQIRDLWAKKDLGTFNADFAPEVPFHGACLFRLSSKQ